MHNSNSTSLSKRNIENILIVRLSAIGDIVMASGFLTALRAHYPKARISWLTQPECASLLEDNPNLDEVIAWPRKQWSDLWDKRSFLQLRANIKTFSAELTKRQFDLAIDLQGLLKSGWLSYLSGAEYRIGLGSREGAQLLMHQVLDRTAASDPLIGSEYRSALEQLGIDAGPFRMHIGIAQGTIESLSSKFPGLDEDATDLIICPFTTRPQKHWPEAHWEELCQILVASGRKVIVLGGPGDKPAGARLAELEGATSLAGQTSLQEAAALISRSRGIIGVDTGLTHMGHAFRVPTLCLFGSTRPYLNPDNPVGEVIYLNKDCAPCRRHPTCGGAFHCLGDIEPQQVKEAFIQLERRIG
jgi:heptosyltransferase-1